MSSRVIRKLHGDKAIGLGIPGAPLPADGDSDEETAVTFTGGTKKKTNINPFHMLIDQSNSPSGSEGQEEENHETEASIAQADHNQQEIGKRKKKKKRKKSTRQSQNARSSEDNVEDDEVERSVKEVNKILGEAAPAPSTHYDYSSGCGSFKCSLRVEQKHLNPSNELKRMFGSKIVQAETRKKRSQRVRTLRSTWLVTAKETWHQIGKQGLSMKLLEVKGGISYFTLEHSPAYQAIEMKFLDAVESLRPDNIVAVINTHPYHVNSLLQLSNICTLSEDLPLAAELVEKALFALECAFHPSFNVALGTCRLEYRRQENRSLYIALFKHILFVGGRACYRTALEFCKLLLALDPEEDPLAIVLAMDFYALRAQEYQWLIDFSEEWEPRRNLSQLPNFAFSVALSRFQVAQAPNGSGDTSLADQMLQDALIMFPGALKQLLDKCSVVVDSKMSSHAFFTVEADKNQSQALGQLIQLYVIQTYHVWKEPDLLPWLQRNAHAVLDRVSANDPLIADAEKKRGIRYVGTPPRNILRYIILCDRKDVTPQGLPANEFRPIISIDPLPPLDSIDVYTRPVRPRLDAEINVFTNFFRSLLPHFNLDEGEAFVDENGEGHDEEEDGGVINDLTTRVRTFMRLLMDTFTHVSEANESEGDETDEA